MALNAPAVSRPTTAVIVAAGRGQRLAPSGFDVPKGLIRLGEKPIVEESLARLEACGITRAIMVTGFKGYIYDGLAERYPSLVQTVHNPRYDQSGNLYSLVHAIPLVNGDFLLLDSDLILAYTHLRHRLSEQSGDLSSPVQDRRPNPAHHRRVS